MKVRLRFVRELTGEAKGTNPSVCLLRLRAASPRLIRNAVIFPQQRSAQSYKTREAEGKALQGWQCPSRQKAA